MAFVVKDRVKETTNTTGTGTLTLAGASEGFQTFAEIGDGNKTYYAIVSGISWEVGIGTYTASGTTLSRDTVLESSNAGSKITLSGVSDVFCTYPAERSVHIDDVGTATASQIAASNGIFVNATTVSANFTVPNNYHALSVGPVTVNGGVSVTVPSGSNWKVI